MEYRTQDVLLFFEGRMNALPLFEAFAEALETRLPQTAMKVQKTQITFSNRHVFACVSFLPVRKKALLPPAYIVVTLGLPYPLDSERAAARTEPYPGRWTTHIVLSSPEGVDEELLFWTSQAYEFAAHK